MIVNELIELVDSLKPNTYDSKHKLQWINEVEGYVWNELHRYQDIKDYECQEGENEYELPENVSFSNILKVFVDGEEIPPITASMINTVGYRMGATKNKVVIYPTPQETGVELQVVYLQPFTRLTDGDATLIDIPYEKVYVNYILAMIDFYNREFMAYNNSVDAFNASLEEYVMWYTSRNPIERNEWGCVYQRQGSPQSLLQKTKTS